MGWQRLERQKDVGMGGRARAKITWQIWRSDLGQIWPIRLSKTTGIAGYFADFANEYWSKMA